MGKALVAMDSRRGGSMWQVERQCDGSGNVSCQPNWRAPQRNEGYELESLVGWGGLSHGETLGRDASTGKNALIPYRNLNTQLVEDLFFRKKECLHLIFFFSKSLKGHARAVLPFIPSRRPTLGESHTAAAMVYTGKVLPPNPK